MRLPLDGSTFPRDDAHEHRDAHRSRGDGDAGGHGGCPFASRLADAHFGVHFGAHRCAHLGAHIYDRASPYGHQASQRLLLARFRLASGLGSRQGVRDDSSGGPGAGRQCGCRLS
jgi:hypothetical protein